jgi:hypothetical protein
VSGIDDPNGSEEPEMRDTIPWATRYLMALESYDIQDNYDHCPESVPAIEHAPKEKQDLPQKQSHEKP